MGYLIHGARVIVDGCGFVRVWGGVELDGAGRRLFGAISVVENGKIGSLKMVNCDVCMDEFHNDLDMCDIILRVKPDLLSRLRSVAVGSA